MCTCSMRRADSRGPSRSPDADALRTLAIASRHGQEVSAVIESMTGARFVHDTLESPAGT